MGKINMKIPLERALARDRAAARMLFSDVVDFPND